ncbi:MAG: magnesium protoporphyrin IX methyltransferase [Paracoccaceae bacterium]
MSLTESETYASRRAELHRYFDATAAETWARLTSDAPVSRIRATVRAGRDAMRAQLLDWLPADLTGRRVLDAGCGTGALAGALAERGAEVLAIDVAENLVRVAVERTEATLPPLVAGRIGWMTGDMLDAGLGRFDLVVAMDSLIHYRQHDMVGAIERLAARTGESLLVTMAPRTRMLAMMHFAGTLFPASDRSPRIEPVPPARLRARLAERGLVPGRQRRVSRGFYISEALEVASR